MTEMTALEPNVLHSPEWPARFYDVAMAFGQGPTLEITTKLKAQDAPKAGIPTETEVNTWARTTGVAMGYLGLKSQYREAIWSGGKTGGENFPSEAELMRKVKNQIFGVDSSPQEYDHLENASTNTLENFVKSLNMMDRFGSESRPFERMVFVCSDFHAARIKFMASLFNIHNVDVLSSEQIVRIMVADPGLDERILENAARVLIGKKDGKMPARVALERWINRRIDPNNVGLNRGKGDYQSYIGGGTSVRDHKKAFTPFEKALEDHPGSPEGVSHTTRMKNEDMFSEGLATMPANWLGFIADVQDDRRFKGIIDNLLEINESFFEPLEINPRAPLSEIRQKLLPYKKEARKFVSLDHTTFDTAGTLPALEKMLTHRAMKRGKHT